MEIRSIMTGNKMANTMRMPGRSSSFGDGGVYVGYDHSRTARVGIAVLVARFTTDTGLGSSSLPRSNAELTSGSDSIRQGWAKVSVKKGSEK